MAYANRGLFCPECGGKTIVRDNAMDKDSNELFRKRMCTACGHEFFTTEFVVDNDEKFHKFWLDLKREHRRNFKEEREKNEAN